jgi:hypothetical protein
VQLFQLAPDDLVPAQRLPEYLHLPVTLDDDALREAEALNESNRFEELGPIIRQLPISVVDSRDARLSAPLRDEYTRTIEPARALAAETVTLERTLSDLVNQAYALTPAEIELMWKTAPPPVNGPVCLPNSGGNTAYIAGR